MKYAFLPPPPSSSLYVHNYTLPRQGKFDLFCRRVIKLIDMFSTIGQFNSLSENKVRCVSFRDASYDSHVLSYDIFLAHPTVHYRVCSPA